MGILRRLPPGRRRIVARGMEGMGRALARLPMAWRPGAASVALGLAARGRRDEAARFLADAATRRGSSPGRLAGTALAIGDPALAEQLAAVPADPAAAAAADPGATLVAADAALARGAFGDAAGLAGAYLARFPDDAYARTLARRLEGELRVREPGWRPAITRSTTAGSPVSGRALHLLSNSLPYQVAGYTVRAHEVARCQVAVGLQPHMATRAGFPLWDGHPGVPPGEVIDGIPYHRLAPMLPITTPADRVVDATTEAAAALVERLRPAVLHPTTNHPNGQAALALRDRFGIPVVYEVRGFLEESWLSRAGAGAVASERYRRTRDVETDVMQAADAIVTLSETMCAEIAERGIPAERITVIPNAVDTERFTPRSPDPALRQRLGLRDGVPVVGYVSTLTAFEGIGYLLQAVSLLRRRGRTVHALIVGDGPQRDALEVQAGRLGILDGTTVFAGRVARDDVAAHYALIDTFVVPRTSDRVSQLVTPLKPYEAMAMERALVVSDVAALREIVSDGETGVVFRAEDPVDLADRLEPLLDDADRRVALGRAARSWVAANRTWTRNGERYRDLYARLGAA
jgi:glycosyltransferase involved in cell wall biosynthesis